LPHNNFDLRHKASNLLHDVEHRYPIEVNTEEESLPPHIVLLKLGG
jgi:hypothetical protein